MKARPAMHKQEGEMLFDQVQQILEREGKPGWQLARDAFQDQKMTSSELQEAINYTLVDAPPDYFRPAFLALCCRAVGGNRRDTVPFSASLILFGKAIGIHDDIIDNLKKRGNRLTAFGKLGKKTALLLSDVLFFKGFTLIRRSIEAGIPDQKMVEALDTIDRIWFEQGEGEVAELSSQGKTTTSPLDCLTKIRMRSSELEATARIGAILGNGSREETKILGKFGRCLGMVSILRNEIIDMLELNVLQHRLRYESLPLPLIYAIGNPKERRNILKLASEETPGKSCLSRLSLATDEAGGMSRVAKHIAKLAHEAIFQLDLLRTGTDELKALTSSMLIRKKEWKSVLETMQASAMSA